MTTTPGTTAPDATAPDTTASAAQLAEEFIRAFHDRSPGRQSVGAEAAPTPDGRTSYQVLAERVAGARRVLDLGCADGALLALLAGQGADVLAGIDLSEAELAVARRRPELAGADLRHGRAQQLPFADGAFDAVVSHMALMLMFETEQVAAEAARVLAPGGTLAVAVGGGAVEGEGQDLFLSLARPYFKAAPAERRIPRLGDRRTRTREGLDGILSPAGFEPVSWDSVTIDMGGTPEKVWASALWTFYDAEELDQAQRGELREAFLAGARDLVSPEGHLACGMRISIATTRLR